MEPTSGSLDREATEGSSRGALFMALFGAIWATAGAGALDGAVRIVLLVISLVLAGALCLGAVRLRQGAWDLYFDNSPRARTRRKHVSRRFNLVFGLEGIAVALAVVLLGRYGMGTFIPAVVALIVGLHFFPLAGLYGVKVYYLTGAALCAVALVAFWVAPSARLQLVGLGSAAVLFATAGYILALGGKARRSGAPAP